MKVLRPDGGCGVSGRFPSIGLTLSYRPGRPEKPRGQGAVSRLHSESFHFLTWYKCFVILVNSSMKNEKIEEFVDLTK